ncbi:DUF6161 domain-containing protein [Mesorhizobium sp. M1005]|uniref:DUF6161 domain-containing protein n=1 Tax=unclassified Mesorhizobium TaxID=325217 RepID=UPI00333AC757
MNSYDPGGQNSREATSLYAQQQTEIYKGITQAFAERMIRLRNNETDVYSSLKDFTDGLINHATTTAPATVLEVEGRSVLFSEIPIVINDSLDEAVKIGKSRPQSSEDIAAAFAAGLIYEMGRFVKPSTTNTPFAVIRELGSYAAWRVVEDAPLDGTGIIAQRLAEITSKSNTLIDDVRSQAALTSNNLRETTESLTERANGALEAAENAAKQAGAFENRAKDLSGQIEAFQAAIDANTQDAEDKLSSFLDAAKARSAYQGVRIYWTDRAGASWWALMISGFVLFVLLVGLPAWAIYDNDAVIRLLKHLTEAAGIEIGNVTNPVVLTVATVSRLVVVTIPLALYFWLIRLVVRFNMRSMLLMDDARQRATIIETYYKMIEQQAATKEDRALILQALCRPPPGHGSDSIEPPNFTEVIDKAMGK